MFEDVLKQAGEAMFQILIKTGCAHVDPRHPRNDACPHCRIKGKAMTDWDDALIAGRRSFRETDLPKET